MRILSLILSLILISFLRLEAQDKSNQFSVKQAVDYALQHNNTYKASQLDMKRARAQVKEITGYGLPQVKATLDLTDYVILPKSFIPSKFFNPNAPENSFTPVTFQPKYAGSAGISASQLLFDGSYLVGLQAARTVKMLSDQQSELSKNQLIENVKKAYYLVLINRERLALLTANLVKLDSTIREVKALNENGFVEKIDLDRLTVTRNNLKVESEKLATFTEISLGLLKLQMGMPINDPLSLTDNLSSVEMLNENSIDEKIKAEQRIEYSLLSTQIRLNELDIKNTKAGFLPRLIAIASYGSSYSTSIFDNLIQPSNWFQLGLVGLKAELPLFAGFSKTYKIQQQKIALEKSKNQMEDFKNATVFQGKQTASTLKNALESVKVQKQNLELSAEVLRVARVKYKQGVGSNLEVINAETSSREAQTNYYSAVYDLIVAQIDYDKAHGQLNP